MNALNYSREPIAAALLRVSLAAMYLAHSIVLKIGAFGMAATVGYFESLGLPGFTAYAVLVVEILGGTLLLANVATGWIAAGLIPVLAGALWVHAPNGWVFTATGGGWEYPLFLIVVSTAVAVEVFTRRPAGDTRRIAASGRTQSGRTQTA